MKTSPMQLAILAVAGFGSIILLSVLAEYRSSEDFKNHLRGLELSNLMPEIRMRRIAEENMESVSEAVPALVEEESEDDDG